MNIGLNSEFQSQPFLFLPLLMARESQNTKTMEKKKSAKKAENSLEGSRGVLLKSIASFLESNGFYKTLDMFVTEAQIQENSWKSSVLDLDDIASGFFVSRNDIEALAIQCDKPQDIENETEKKERMSSNGNVGDSETPVEEGEGKKERKEKKKKSNVDKPTPEQETEEPNEDRKELKNEKKKKNKKHKEQLENKDEELKSSNDENKDERKTKKNKELKESSEIDRKENNGINHEDDKEKSTAQQQNGVNGEKVSKKRKKLDSKEENDCEANIGNGTTARVIENENKEPKSAKKGKPSDEAKSANAFKRVKIEEVNFADQRLQDNSYWAKDGADSGYGAKAQQILEQVRGRDFRHEKTKKKRGSYRGGQIDLQSHSIKFNYSDEE